jgi:hypothetical protein
MVEGPWMVVCHYYSSGANSIGLGHQLLAVETLHISYSIAIMRTWSVAMKVTCRKYGWSREGLAQSSIIAVNGDD